MIEEHPTKPIAARTTETQHHKVRTRKDLLPPSLDLTDDFSVDFGPSRTSLGWRAKDYSSDACHTNGMSRALL